MKSTIIEPSELILNKDGSVYHLKLLPEHISDDIILVGDPSRVKEVSRFFTKIEFKQSNREFITCTGTFNNKRITVLSTGIGTDNIDIVLNELDALANVDLNKRIIKSELRKLNFIRLGTSGATQANIPIDSIIVSKKSIGFDGVLNFYANRNMVCDLEFENRFVEYTSWNKMLPSPYVVKCSNELYEKLGKDILVGNNISASGFYGPQGRVIRLGLEDENLNKKIENFEFENQKITHYEMESSAIYGLSALLGHNAITICSIIANRVTKQYSKNYKPCVKKMIKSTLIKLTE